MDEKAGKGTCEESDSAHKSVEAVEAQNNSASFQESDLGIMPGTASQHSRAQSTKDVVLRIECITDRQMKVGLGVSFTADVLATVALFTEFSLKITQSKDNWPTTAHKSAVANVLFGGLGLLLLLWMAILWIKRFLASPSGACWKHRRRRMSILVGAEVAVQTVNLLAFIIPNASMLHSPCSDYNQLLVTMCVLIRWTCWNTLFLLICIHAHNVNPWRSKDSLASVVMGLLNAWPRFAMSGRP
ncbi:hypothetical protein WJX74_007392 [Apatococcus lobatus]|uniref:Uncharacterized protein n=1 Tax=Apatococcus lobatus TaxID=904363 RepID=A0AAW1QKB4_9CHLO